MILVLGGQGQLGQELQRQAAVSGTRLVALGSQQCDITNQDSVRDALAANRPDVVINCAAYTAVDRAESEPDRAMLVNAEGAGVVAQACQAVGVPLVHLSTDYVFSGEKAGAYVETDPVAPIGVYGRSKEAGEVQVRAGTRRHLILRTSWVFGAFGHNFLKTMLRLAGERDELRVVADQHGCPTATPGLARALLAIAPRLTVERHNDGPWGTYHLTGPTATSWHGFACEIVDCQAKFTGRKPRVTAIATADFPTPARRPANSVLDCSRFRNVFGLTLPDWRDETARIIDDLIAGA